MGLQKLAHSSGQLGEALSHLPIEEVNNEPLELHTVAIEKGVLNLERSTKVGRVSLHSVKRAAQLAPQQRLVVTREEGSKLLKSGTIAARGTSLDGPREDPQTSGSSSSEAICQIRELVGFSYGKVPEGHG